MIEFPEGFVWGTATAAHQIEGGCWNNDWWAWEHDPRSPCAEPSGDACDSWHRWPEDVALCRDLGFGSYRFSLEWSRIEPEDGEWSHAAVDHYRAQCQAVLDAGLEPVVTLHHFTTPRWLAAQGGWEEPGTAERFARYCGRVAGELAPVLRRVCTINEPNVVSVAGYLGGFFPPGRQDVEARRRVNQVLIEAHRGAVEAVRAETTDVPVGLTLSMSDYQAVDGGEAKRDQIRFRMEDEFLAAVEGDDFLGVQTYSRTRVGPDGVKGPEPGQTVLQMGYEYWPPSLEATLRRAWEVTGVGCPCW